MNYPSMTTFGLALDRNGDIWQFKGANGMVKIASLGGGDMTLDFGDAQTFDAGATIPRGFWVFNANPVGGYGGIVFGANSTYVSVSQYKGTLVFCDGENDKVNAAADPGPTLSPIKVVALEA